jgi:hypothetical protein
MRRRATIITFLLVLLTPLVSLAGGTQAAWAQVSCDSTNVKFGGGFNWNHRNSSGNRDVRGVRAPIENRTDGALCDFSSYSLSDDTTWIGIFGVGGAPSDIVQIGIRRLWDSGGGRHECMWWQVRGGTNNIFNCDTLTNDTDYYFMIHDWNNDTQYVIDSCGTSGSYDNCAVKNSTAAVFNFPASQINAEAHWSCGLHIFGNSTDQQNVGISTSFVQGLADDNQWKARTWDQLSSDCTQYYVNDQQNQGETMKYYDTRNTQ